jgi:hypothetical protein
MKAQKKMPRTLWDFAASSGVFSRFLALRPTSNRARSAPGRFPPWEAVRKGEPIIRARVHDQLNLLSQLSKSRIRRNPQNVKNSREQNSRERENGLTGQKQEG